MGTLWHFPNSQYVCMWNDASSEFDCGEIYLTRFNLWLVFSNAPVYWPFCRGITRKMGEESSEVWGGRQKMGKGVDQGWVSWDKKAKTVYVFVLLVLKKVYTIKKLKHFWKTRERGKDGEGVNGNPKWKVFYDILVLLSMFW